LIVKGEYADSGAYPIIRECRSLVCRMIIFFSACAKIVKKTGINRRVRNILFIFI
jgi:hypothetical protein